MGSFDWAADIARRVWGGAGGACDARQWVGNRLVTCLFGQRMQRSVGRHGLPILSAARAHHPPIDFCMPRRRYMVGPAHNTHRRPSTTRVAWILASIGRAHMPPGSLFALVARVCVSVSQASSVSVPSSLRAGLECDPRSQPRNATCRRIPPSRVPLLQNPSKLNLVPTRSKTRLGGQGSHFAPWMCVRVLH
jgi:hypothetical protein